VRVQVPVAHARRGVEQVQPHVGVRGLAIGPKEIGRQRHFKRFGHASDL
jgi:hypothetical protein